MTNRKTLAGFELTIVDEAPVAKPKIAVNDIIVIYGILPDYLKYEDEEGNVFDKYIEPNKPFVITSTEDAIKTLEISDLHLTKEVTNLIKLAPDNATLALCKIVKRNGENPDPENLTDMYEALDFAFEETENYPMKQVLIAGLSLDQSVANKPNEQNIKYNKKSDGIIKKSSLMNIIGKVKKIDSDVVDKNIQFDLGIELSRDNESKTQKDGIGIYSDIVFKLNGKTANCIIREDEDSLKEMKFQIKTRYNVGAESEDEKVTIESLVSPTSNPANKIAAIGNSLNLTLGEKFLIKIDEEHVLEINQGVLEIEELGQAKTGEDNTQEDIVHISKNCAECHILLRALKHVHTMTKTKNNCMLFMSPEPPRNQSNVAKKEYIERVQRIVNSIKAVTQTVPVLNGKQIDLGMYLTVVVGSNRLYNIGGLYGFNQTTVAKVNKSQVTTKKMTNIFSIGDIVEVYTYDKLNILTHKAKVTQVEANDDDTTTVLLDTPVIEEISGTKAPIYIMNVNDKDFTGNYMAMQWSRIVEQAGLDRSPEGIVWDGECQMAFSAKELDLLNSLKLCVLDQLIGTNQGAVSRSQLMTGPRSTYQDVENLITVYALTSGAKAIGSKYLGERFDSATEIALVKSELEETVFKPAIGRYITSGYDLRVTVKRLREKATNKEIYALMMYFEVTEIKTLKALRITAKIN